jgi:uncharacterized protein (DUF4415 family)
MKSKSPKISQAAREAYEKERALSNDPERLSIEKWERGTIGKHYRPIKTLKSVRLDNDILKWLESKGEEGVSTRINEILRGVFLEELKQQRREQLKRSRSRAVS